MKNASRVSVLALLAAAPAFAQVPPDAGQILEQSQDQRVDPLAPSVNLDLHGEPLSQGESGGTQVSLETIRFQGNTRFGNQRLLDVLGEAARQPQDLAGLNGLANRISQFYRDQGYPFARALLPAQDLGDGILTIQVVEGRYDRVRASGPAWLAAELQPWLAPLEPDAPIESAPLERQLLLLGDLPGVDATPVMRPGSRTGTGELDVQVREGRRVAGFVGVDNQGSRYSGEYRARAGVSVNRVAKVGDELSLSALYSNEKTWLGSLGYSLPIGYDGLRGNLGYAHTDYTLGKGFDGFSGTADVYTAGLSYPLLRSQRANLVASGGFQYKDLDDDIDFLDYRKATDSYGLPFGLHFDLRDNLGAGGVSYGELTLTSGSLERSQTGAEDDSYRFTKLELDVVRLQALGLGFELYGRFGGQWSDRRQLDGSESFYLGGPNGVRAYPVGEGNDSRGWLTQFELRYRAGLGLSPYAFYDAGRTSNGGIADGEARKVAGAGVGVRYHRAGLDLDLASAWPTEGGDANSDDRQRDPRLWASLGYRF